MPTAAPAKAKPFGSLFRHLESAAPLIPFDSGNTRTVELSRSYLIKRLVLRLTGSVTYATAPSGVGSESPLALIKSVELIADGRKTLVRAAGKDLFRLAHITNGKRGELTPPTFPGSSPVPFSATIIIDHQALRFVKPVDSYLDPRGFEKLELRVTWGTLADIATGGTTVAIAPSTQISPTLIQTTEGEFDIIASKLITSIQKQSTATLPNFEIVLPRTGLLAGVLFRTDRDGGTGPVVADNILNKITLKSDNNISHVDSIIAADLQRRNVVDYQLDAGGGADGQISGYYYLDVTEDGRLMSALNTFVLNEIKFLLDVTYTSGTELITATMLQFEPASGR